MYIKTCNECGENIIKLFYNQPNEAISKMLTYDVRWVCDDCMRKNPWTITKIKPDTNTDGNN